MSISLGTILSKLEDKDGGTRNVRPYDRRQDLSKEDQVDGEGTTTRKQDDNPNAYGDGVAILGESSMGLVEDQALDMPNECWGTRHTLGFMGLLGTACVYGMRVNLSVAIVAMVKTEPKNYTNSSNEVMVCPPSGGSENDTSQGENQGGEFDWDEATQGTILGVFFYGYMVTNLVGGRAAELFGGKVIFGWGVFLTAVFTILSPLCAQVSTGLFIAIRVLEGLSEGVIFPAMNALLAEWVPPMERARFSSLVYAGAQFGTVVTMPVSGWLCDTDFLGGWPSVFYVFGGLGIVWSIAWYFLVYSNPQLHPRITKEEKAYIVSHCGGNKVIAIPWYDIFTSLPFWSVLVVHVGYNWGFYTLLTELPTYLKNIQHFDMTSNGLVSALPYLVMWIFSLIYSNIMSHLQSKGTLSILTVRRLAVGIGVYIPMLGLIAMCFVDCDKVLAVVVLCIAVGFCGAVYSGYLCSHQDMSPNLAGTLMGFTNAAANIPGFTAPLVTGLITNDNQTLEAWRTVFIISAVVYFVSASFYIAFVSADVQPWNFPKGTQDKEKDGKYL